MEDWVRKSIDIFLHPETWGDTIAGGVVVGLILLILSAVLGFVGKLLLTALKRLLHFVMQKKDQKSFCQNYQSHLDQLNEAANWDEKYFTPLEAEVESDHNGRRKKYYQSLLTCIKKNRKKQRVFLLLGLPGSGKSVALRKLCGELLADAKWTGQIPLYLNLKEWGKPFTLSDPPTEDDLFQFIFKQLKSTKKPDIYDYLTRERFDQLRKKKKLFFIFDSFDELPCLLGKEPDEGIVNHEELIGRLSSLLYHFLTTTAGAGGIVASRLHNAPAQMKADFTLTIQEFSDIKIRKTLEKYEQYTSKMQQSLFEQRGDLVSLCRNPMYLHLTICYLRDTEGQLPANQEALYHNFVSSCLKRFADEDAAQRALCLLAAAMDAEKDIPFAQDRTKARCFGLEYPTDKAFALWQQELLWTEKQCEAAILTFADTKLCRRSQNENGQKDVLTFVHRRFQEYFLVESWKQSHQKPEYEQSILQENGHRDALVLYCEIAELAVAQEIAAFCWEGVKERTNDFEALRKDITVPQNLELVHLLIFMRDAFCHRRDALPTEFEKEFFHLCEKIFEKDVKVEYYIQLAFTHALILLSKVHCHVLSLQVLDVGILQHGNIVLNNYRYLGVLDYAMEKKLLNHLWKTPIRQFRKHFFNVQFCFSAKEFCYLRRKHTLLWICKESLFFSTLLVCFLMPVFFLTPILYFKIPAPISSLINAIFCSFGILFGIFFVVSLLDVCYTFLHWCSIKRKTSSVSSIVKQLCSSIIGLLSFIRHFSLFNILRHINKFAKKVTHYFKQHITLPKVLYLSKKVLFYSKQIIDFPMLIAFICAAILLPSFNRNTGIPPFAAPAYLYLIGFVFRSEIHDLVLLPKMNLPCFRSSPSHITRSQLEQYFSKSKAERIQRWCLKRLFSSGVSLTGQWTNNERPALLSPEADELLSRLDHPEMQVL